MTGLEEVKAYVMNYVKHYKAPLAIGSVFALLAVMLAVFFLTNDKDAVVTSGFVVTENTGYQSVQKNPLKESHYEDVNRVVTKYYERQAKRSEYIERYEDIVIYTKLGRYEGTYVVFVYYQMKIPEIYTTAPGLDSLYVYEDSEKELCISTDVNTDELKGLVSELVAHEDVQALLDNVKQEYQEAVESDAMLAEALEDLIAAYKQNTD